MSKSEAFNWRLPWPTMIELTRTDDMVFVSWLESRLADVGIRAYVFDAYTSSVYGTALGAIQRRILVDDADLPRARRVMQEVEGGRDG